MENLELPPELEHVERLLVYGPKATPSASLRRRVLDGIRSELRSERALPRWRMAACAATLLIGLGLSLGVLHATGFAMQPCESSPSVYEVAWRLQQLSPSLSREESLRQASLRQISVNANSQTQFGEIPPEPTTP